MKRFLSVLFAACMAIGLFAQGVTYSVTAPEGTNQVYLYGEATGNTFLRMQKASDGTYTVTVPTANITLTYNYASGNGEQYREVKSDGKDVDPRTYKGSDIVSAWKAVAPADGLDPQDPPIVEPEGLTYKVTVPDGTPAVYIAGVFNEWSFTEMTKVDDKHYTITIANAKTTDGYKYLCGPDWQYEETDQQDNRTYAEADVVKGWKALPGEQGTGLTYKVTVPEGTPAVYIAGVFNSWSFTEMTKVDDLHYTITIENAKVSDGYKYLCGPDWKYEESDQQDNRTYAEADVVKGWKAVPGDQPQPGEKTYYLTGETLVGGWDAKQAEMENGEYTIEALAAGTYQFKVTDGSWDAGHNWGGAAVSSVEGATVTTAEDGNVVMVLAVESNVTIKFDGTHITIVAVATGVTPPQPEGLTYNVTVPEGTPAVYIAGEFNEWTFTAMEKVDDTHYALTIDNAKATDGYKYLCGEDWKYVEKDAEGGEVADRTYSENDVVAKWAAVPGDLPQPEGVTYNVTVPEGTPAVYIAGAWDDFATFTAMEKVDNTHYTVTIENSITAFLYKYLCGPDWKYVEKDAEGNEIADRTYSENDVVAKWAEVPGEQPTVEPIFTKTELVTFGENDVAEYAESTTFGSLIVVADEDAKVSVDANNKKYDELAFTHRLKLGGAGTAAGRRVLKANVTGACTVNIYALSSSSSADRTLNLDLNEFVGNGESAVHTQTFTVRGKVEEENRNVELLTYEYKGEGAASLYTYSATGGINIYGFEVKYGGDQPQPEGLTYNVTVPEGTPAVYIAGAWDEFASFTAMTKVDDTHYTITLENATTAHGYKYLCGDDWKYVEKDAEGNEIADRTYSENDVVAKWAAVPGDQPHETIYYITGESLVGGWDAKQEQMGEGSDGKYIFMRTLEGGTYEFKITDGSWDEGHNWGGDAVSSVVGATVSTSADGNVVMVIPEKSGVTIEFDGEHITIEAVPIGIIPPDPGEGLTYNVTVPEGTPAVYIAGAWDEFASFTAMTKVDDTHYTITLENATAAMGYKYLCGEDWKYVEKDAEGNEIADRTYSENDVVAKWAAVPGDQPQPEGLTYNVTVPEGTPAVYIAGAWDEFASFTAMTKVDDTHYTITLENATTAMGYKYLCGEDWKYVEKDAEGNEIADRTYSENDVVAKWAAVPGDLPQPGEGLTYNVTVPEGTPAVYIAGDFNGWTFTPMTKVDDTHYTITIEGATTADGYKYLCGDDWKYEETDQQANRVYSENDVVKGWKLTPGGGESITYNVTVPEGTPAVYIAGDFNGWSFTPMTKVDDTHYTITIDGATTAMGYKYLCGPDWKYEEIDQTDNRTYSENDVVKGWKAIPGDISGLNSSVVINYWVENSTLNVNLVGAQRVMMFDVNGRMVDNRMSNDFYQIQLPAGVYMLRVDSSVVKVAIR